MSENVAVEELDDIDHGYVPEEHQQDLLEELDQKAVMFDLMDRVEELLKILRTGGTPREIDVHIRRKRVNQNMPAQSDKTIIRMVIKGNSRSVDLCKVADMRPILEELNAKKEYIEDGNIVLEWQYRR